MSAPVILVGATRSDAGKTTFTLGLIRALKRRGLKVGAFKVGPDYIDPGYLGHAAGRPCHNLDTWAMRLETLVAGLDRTGEGADVVVGEGVMGLFDGAPDGGGSTADLASIFNLPVLLLADCQGAAQSVAYTIDGFVRGSESVEVVGVALNRVAGPDHEALLRKACDERFSTRVLGALPRDPSLRTPSRHLGLLQASERADLEAFVERAAALVEERVDLERVLRLARPANVSSLGNTARPLPPIGANIAVARDEAFMFAYPPVLEGWAAAGVALTIFSPLADQPPDAGSDAVYLPGGYPELHAGRLAGNGAFLRGLRKAAERGAAVYGECGGYMVLGQGIADKDGARHAMAGLLPIATSFERPKLTLGYRQVALLEDNALGMAGASFRGHEFHHAVEAERPAGLTPLFEARDSRSRALPPQGAVAGNVSGSFVHLIDRR